MINTFLIPDEVEWTGDNVAAEKKIKEYLKSAVAEEVYDRWINDFTIERIDNRNVVIGYYGENSLKEFKKDYGEAVSTHIRSVLGEDKKIKIYNGNNKSVKYFYSLREKKHFKVVKWFSLSLIFVAIMLLILIIAGNYIGNRKFKETFYNVSSLKTNNIVRVIQVSDLHRSVYGKDNSKLAERIEKLKPDIILFTGDNVASSKRVIKRTVELSDRLNDVAPTYYIYGNNEIEMYYDVPLNQEELDNKYGFDDSNRDPARLIRERDSLENELESRGVKVLKNEMDTILVGTTEVDVFGVLTSNPSAFWSYGGENFDKYIYENTNRLKITAMHEPVVLEEFEPESWGDLIVCGHTHGGVIKIPALGPIYTHEGGLFPERKGALVYGRYDASGGAVIVGSGLTNSNIFRINNQPELVIIDVNKF